MAHFHVLILSAGPSFHSTCSIIDQLVTNNPQDFVEMLTNAYNNHSSSMVRCDSQHRYYTELRWIQFLVKAYKQSTPIPSIEDVKDALSCNTTLSPNGVNTIVSALEVVVSGSTGVTHIQVRMA